MGDGYLGCTLVTIGTYWKVHVKLVGRVERSETRHDRHNDNVSGFVPLPYLQVKY